MFYTTSNTCISEDLIYDSKSQAKHSVMIDMQTLNTQKSRRQNIRLVLWVQEIKNILPQYPSDRSELFYSAIPDSNS